LRWAELLARLRGSGRAMPIKDSLIAVAALIHGLVVATCNRTDFENGGLKVADPCLLSTPPHPGTSLSLRALTSPPGFLLLLEGAKFPRDRGGLPDGGVKRAEVANAGRTTASLWRTLRCSLTISPRVRYRIRQGAGTASRSSAEPDPRLA